MTIEAGDVIAIARALNPLIALCRRKVGCRLVASGGYVVGGRAFVCGRLIDGPDAGWSVGVPLERTDRPGAALGASLYRPDPDADRGAARKEPTT